MARRRRPRRGRRYQAGRNFPKPPPQYYDPQFDQQERASDRGIGDLTQDLTKAQTRDTVDYNIGRQNIHTGLRQAGQDYLTQTHGLQRQFAQLGSQQAQAANAAGVGEGGALAQALRKRAQNYQLAKQPLDVGLQRSIEGAKTQAGQLALGTQRAAEDRAVQLARAQRENKFFKTDVSESRFRAAQGAGWTGATDAPHGVKTRYGVSFVRSRAHKGYYKLASGRYVTRHELRSILRRHKRRG